MAGLTSFEPQWWCSGGALVVRYATGQVDLVTYFGAAGIGIIVGREQTRQDIDDPLSHLVISRGATRPDLSPCFLFNRHDRARVSIRIATHKYRSLSPSNVDLEMADHGAAYPGARDQTLPEG
ncbi:hypothetical protein ABZ260_25915 [Streptosporangium sp. NPDC006013]|uniref:hypothetical protein n=1 Tax=Streptosporangium sp. NPDC006013 TaxID=3155596 RepID=UPI0033BDF0F7